MTDRTGGFARSRLTFLSLSPSGGAVTALLGVAILACAALLGAGCPLVACPKTEETLPLPEADGFGDAGAAEADGGAADGGIQEAAARCRASANDCMAYCQAAVPGALQCQRVTTDGGGYAVRVVHEVPCL
jgi:hypothetical protein